MQIVHSQDLKKTNDNIGTEINIVDATCDITDGSANVTMDSTANIKVGMKITGIHRT